MAPSTDKILVVDACADELRSKGQELLTKPPELLPVQLYSSKLGEASFFDPYLRMSVFTHYFVEALARADELGIREATGNIESDAVRRHVYRYVPLHAKAEQKKQQPLKNVPLVQHPWGSGGSNLILAERITRSELPPIDPKATEGTIQISG